MRIRVRGFVVAVAVSALAALGTQPARGAPPVDPGDAKVGASARAATAGGDPVDVIVMLRSDATSTAVGELQRSARAARSAVADVTARPDVEVRRTYQTVPALSLRVESGEALDALAANPAVLRVDETVGGTGALANSVPFVSADDLHTLGVTGAGATVAVLDTGADTDHPDLAADIVHQECFGNGPVDFCPNGTARQSGAGAAEDDAGHGTHVTGIVTSDGVVSSVGVAPGADVVAIKVMDACAFSGCFYDTGEIVAALDFVTANPQLGVDAVNMSLGTGATFAGTCDTATAWTMALAASVTNLRAAGVIPFASAGNNASSTNMGAPACISGVVAVGATDTADNIAAFSNASTALDLLGPGVSVISDAIGGGTRTASGTSMAGPTAAGCAALLVSGGYATSPAAIESRLEASPVRLTDARNGLSYPRLDCLHAAVPGSPTVSIGDAAVAEGDSGTRRKVTFSVTLSEPSTTAVDVAYKIVPGTAGSPGDVDARSGAQRILKFQLPTADLTATTKYVTVLTQPDALPEGDESFTVQLQSVSAGYVIGDAVGTGTIADDDQPNAGIAIADALAYEGDTSTRTNFVKVPITLTAPQAGTVTVQYTLVPMTATGGLVDFDHKAGRTFTAVFNPGQVQKLVAIKLTPDLAAEGAETFRVALSNPVGLPLAVSSAMVTIADDD